MDDFLADQENKILDRVWDRIAAEEAAKKQQRVETCNKDKSCTTQRPKGSQSSPNP